MLGLCGAGENRVLLAVPGCGQANILGRNACHHRRSASQKAGIRVSLRHERTSRATMHLPASSPSWCFSDSKLGSGAVTTHLSGPATPPASEISQLATAAGGRGGGHEGEPCRPRPSPLPNSNFSGSHWRTNRISWLTSTLGSSSSKAYKPANRRQSEQEAGKKRPHLRPLSCSLPPPSRVQSNLLNPLPRKRETCLDGEGLLVVQVAPQVAGAHARIPREKG